MLLDLLAPLQQDVEELHEAKGGQQETQHLKRTGKKRLEELSGIYSHICQYVFVDICDLAEMFLLSLTSVMGKALNNREKTGQSLCEVSPSWRCRGRTFECVRGHGSRDEGSRRGPATTDRYRGPTRVLCSGSTGSDQGWLCTTYGSSPTKGSKKSKVQIKTICLRVKKLR